MSKNLGFLCPCTWSLWTETALRWQPPGTGWVALAWLFFPMIILRPSCKSMTKKFWHLSCSCWQGRGWLMHFFTPRQKKAWSCWPDSHPHSAPGWRQWWVQGRRRPHGWPSFSEFTARNVFSGRTFIIKFKTVTIIVWLNETKGLLCPVRRTPRIFRTLMCQLPQQLN